MRRIVSVILAVAVLAMPGPAMAVAQITPPTVPTVTLPVPAPVPVTVPSQVPLPPGAPTPSAPKPGSVTISSSISQQRVQQLGIRVQLRLPRGSDTVQIVVRKGNRVVVRTVRTNPPRAFRVAETKRLTRGRYTLEIRVGSNAKHLGPASKVTFVVT